MPNMPQQDIFSNDYAYGYESINIYNLKKAESVLSQKYESSILAQLKEAFYKDLVKLYDNGELTRKSLLTTLEQHQKYTNHQSTYPLCDMHIIELLKEQKNCLIQKNHQRIMNSGPIFNNNALNYLLFAGFSCLAAGFRIVDRMCDGTYKPTIDKEATFCIGIFLTAITLIPLTKVYSIYRSVRSREAEMNKIDKMISVIEEIEYIDAIIKYIDTIEDELVLTDNCIEEINKRISLLEALTNELTKKQAEAQQ